MAGVVLALVPLLAFGGLWGTLMGRTVQDLGHVPLFGWVATLLVWIAQRRLGARIGPYAQYLGAFAVALGLGLATELIQMIGPRDADPWDLFRNGVGAACALVLCMTFDRRFDGTRLRGKWGRAVFRGIVVVALISSAAPLIDVAAAYRDRSRRMPVLYDFSSRSQARFMHARRASWQFTTAPVSWADARSRLVAHVRFGDYVGSALIFNEPFPDWTGQDTLVFEIFHPGEARIKVGIRVDDQHEHIRGRDRFGQHVFLDPGFNRIRVPLDAVLHGPADRLFDLKKVKRMVLFPVEPVGDYELYLGSIALTTESSKSPG